MRLLHNVPIFYNSHAVPNDFLLLLNLASDVTSDKKVQTVIWLSSFMNVSIADTKAIVTRISSIRSLRTGNSDRGQDVLSHNFCDALIVPVSVSDKQPARGSKITKAGTIQESNF